MKVKFIIFLHRLRDNAERMKDVIPAGAKQSKGNLYTLKRDKEVRISNAKIILVQFLLNDEELPSEKV